MSRFSNTMDQFFPGPGAYQNTHDATYNNIYKVFFPFRPLLTVPPGLLNRIPFSFQTPSEGFLTLRILFLGRVATLRSSIGAVRRNPRPVSPP